MTGGIVFDIKRFALHDGPGIRTTLFLKGCSMTCWWCHNPEGQKQQPEHIYRQDLCAPDCTECIDSCSRNALIRTSGRIAIDLKRCRLCGDCAEVCPTEALEFFGRTMTAEEVLTEIEKDRVFFEESDGGVTFSGGEPLMQPEFLASLLSGCRNKGIHTAVDTSGHASFEVLETIAGFTDLFLFDIKTLDEGKHIRTSGVSNRKSLTNLKKLAAMGSRITVRIPVIPGINDSIEEISQIGAYIQNLDRIKDISLLPYHNIGNHKYRNLNLRNRMASCRPPDEKTVEALRKRLEEFGFTVKIGA